jgi:hypothetical protein
MLNPMSLTLGASGKAPPARGATVLRAVVEGSPMAVSVMPDIRSRLIGSIVVGTAPRGGPTDESIGGTRGRARLGWFLRRSTEQSLVSIVTRDPVTISYAAAVVMASRRLGWLSIRPAHGAYRRI